MAFLDVARRDPIQGGNVLDPDAEGHSVDLANPPSIGNYVVISSVLLLVLATIALVARLLTRVLIVKKLRWDDCFVVMAWFLAVARVAVGLHSVYKYYSGIHTWDIPRDNLIAIGNNSKNLYFIGDMLYFAAIACAKTSILMFYLYTFSQRCWFRQLCYFLIAFVWAQSITWFFIWAFECNPVSVGWHMASAHLEHARGSCISFIRLARISGGIFIATDFIMLVLPISFLSLLKISLKQKLALCFMFATGTFAVVAAIVRQVIVVTNLSYSDQTWSSVKPVAWLTIELLTGIICACLPTLGPLYTRVNLTLPSTFLPPLRRLFRSPSCSVSGAKSQEQHQWPRYIEEDLSRVPSGSGGTTISITQMLQSSMLQPPPDHVYIPQKEDKYQGPNLC